ncbi:MAG: AAA family ATPase [Ilumatobacteraceae bacterium]
MAPPEVRPPCLRSMRLGADAPTAGYPFELAAVRQLDLEFGAVTVIVGDNGSGKSTIVEALAIGAGFNAEGGGRNLQFETLATHSELHRHVELRWRQRPQWGWFLRAETFYGMASYIARDDDARAGVAALFPDLHGRSHGQSFLELIQSRFSSPGLYVMDEPESALSFHGQLQLLRFIHDGVAGGAQFVLATHSPLLMRAGGGVIYELADDGISRTSYDDLEIVGLWRHFLDAPERVLDVLYADD